MAKSPKPRALKVFRTAIGFHDAYVAAPSRAAALRAWGSDKDLFALGSAEEVTDPALAEEALASPGAVIKRLRGTAAEQIAALPPHTPKRARPAPEDTPPASRKARPTRTSTPPAPPPPSPKPKPSRRSLDEAETALTQAEKAHAAALRTLVEREVQLARERRDLERTQAGELRRLTHDRDEAATDYDEAMRRWRT